MPPKNKGKKGKKGGDDDYWADAGEAVAPAPAAQGKEEESDNDSSAPKPKAGFSAFAALADDGGPEIPDENEDFGGLMSAIKASSGKKKDKKKKNKAVQEDEDDEIAEGGAPADKGPVQMTAEELADEEWGPVKDKKKKDKKGKKKSNAVEDDEEPEAAKETPIATPQRVATPQPQAEPDADGDADEADSGPKVLSKKEKEKLKKEKEKAKKKAQAAAKKAATAGDTESAPAPAPAPASAPEPQPSNENDEDGDEAAPGKSDSKKKKKKKGKKDEEPAPAPAPAAASKKPAKGGIGALRAMMEEKKRLEEEAKRREEEERLRIEEEERQIEEENRKKEEEKQRKKEKEKAKKEQLKKEGKLLTKKQKEERQMAEMRKQALLASGVQIEGLQQASGSAPPAAKKVVYGNRKKKGPTTKDASPAPESRPRSPEVTPAPPPEPVPAEPAKEDAAAKSDWENSSGEEKEAKRAASAVKDDWDASSDDEAKKEDKPAPTPKAAPSAKKPAGKATEAKKPAPAQESKGKPAPGKKAAPPSESSSESSSGSDSDESDSDDSDEDSDSSDEELSKTQQLAAKKKAEAAARRAKAHEAAMAARNKDDLRSPICCILGHVDTGKTKLLDKIRQTNVQEGEAGGITQQIGATYFPVDAIKTKTAVMNQDNTQEYKIPGLLVIDTPGHESFTNLRTRGSSLCNIAILVVDIMHGLEAQTLESLRLLRDKKTPFIVALNKIDRIYGWQATPDNAFRDSLAKQTHHVQREFEDRVTKTIVAFAEEGLNAVLYYENKNFARNVSLVPTSAITGEGVPDMIMLLVNLTQQRMSDRLMYLSELECTVLEVKVIEGLGTTIDVVLSNGILREGERIVVCGLNGPIVTQVRALLTPQPLRELRIKSAYVHHKEVKAALGVKIAAPDLEKAIAGSRLLVVGPDDDEDDLKDEVMSDLTTLLNSIDKSGRGVCVQASTLGSLEALLDFLKSSKIPVSGINIGPVYKRDVMRAGTMLEKAKELACILCFDVTVDKEAERLAEEMGIRLFKADIIYHLFDAFKAYNEEITEAKRRDAAPSAVWPCRLKIIAAFCKRDPIIVGVDILEGSLRVGTPLAVVKVDPATGAKTVIDLGKITSLEINHKTQDVVKKSQAGGGVAVKIEHAVYQSAKMFGRHFDDKDEVLSHISRQSIDVLKTNFRHEATNEDWLLIKALKPRSLGYKQQLHRTWNIVESFAASFCAINFIGGVRTGLFLGLLAGGPAAIWSSYIVSIFFMLITAAVLAEICSALPLSGSIYIWAAESAGPKYARFVGFIVAWWSCTAWMTFAAGNCQTTANYIVSQLAVWEIDFPGGIGNDNVKWRALIWAIAEVLLVVVIAINRLPPRVYSFIFRASMVLMIVDMLLCMIWLPIGASRTYGIRSAKDVFTQTYNGTGAAPGWNWILSFLFTAGTLTGFDASGHIAEETKNARVVAGKGILSSVVATGTLGFATTILFLFCTPDLDTLFSLNAPQPFVQLYALALGRGPSIFMTVLAILGLILNTSVAIVAASRLIFAVARDGVLPMSHWIGQVDHRGQPRNAVTVMYIFGAILLCSILPSQVAFYSLVSAGGVPTIAAYGLIGLLRLTCTPDNFQSSYFFLGKYRKVLYALVVVWCGLIVAVMLSPFFFPVTPETFNFACVIFSAATIFGILSWYLTPEDKWLRREQVVQAFESANTQPPQSSSGHTAEQAPIAQN
ncbi:hypothetical protein EST38_g1624 [Candolleomyces aberdarensis]|uniref:Eukaryotic translation initiation factor 5B n=1 Tax=Candolleomyces aberdarensis TaxID=2316362 RepID=A0A4Q2DVL8_9AGAR|nr:hypothetical protein EST38_g1624 [Candolleomyces aberdarensis]